MALRSVRDRRWWAALAVMTLLAVAVVRVGVAALGTDRPAPGAEAGVDRPMVVPRARLVKSEFDSLVDVIRASAAFQSSRVLGAPAVADDPAVPRPARPILYLGGMVGEWHPLLCSMASPECRAEGWFKRVIPLAVFVSARFVEESSPLLAMTQPGH